MKKPRIGIVLDREVEGDYSEYPFYVLREHYFDAVRKSGGIPLGIDHAAEYIADYTELLDGLLMPGGDYDIPPHVYGDTAVHETVITKPERLQFDLDITQKFLDNNKPVLGICAGEQLLAVLLGGTLVQDIATEIPDALNHYSADRMGFAHDIDIVDGTLLHSIIGKTKIEVNSHHHQAVKHVARNLTISARSSDGVVEAIEVPDQKFCLGVQWHPEYLTNENDRNIFRAFIEACR